MTSHINQHIVALRVRWLLSVWNNIDALVTLGHHSTLSTRAIVVRPGWPNFKAVTKELKLIKPLPKREKVFTRTTPTCTNDPPDLYHVFLGFIVDRCKHTHQTT